MPATPRRGDVVGGEVYDGRRWLPVIAPRDESCVGPAGADGRDGRDGRDGADSTIPGPPGRDGRDGADGARGPRGKAGRDGHSYSYTRVAHTHDPTGVPIQAIFDSTAGKGAVVFVSGNGHVDLAQANGEPQTLAVGVVIDDIVQSGSVGRYVTTGVVSGLTGLSAGTVYYLDPDVPGGLTSTFPDALGNAIVVVGTAVSETELSVHIDWKGEIGT